ncbi:PhoD-like (alkaline) phosphatase family protein [Babesia bovis T2Bo]|uniref:PhoD-like (alkaline) phosphatase family protein n=1 Tax=Babesia bovis T2Bo TaxID=484906 RepID=UPI001C363355|nr:PhoD-like (alkaline) phosphatase family protein [Babesia bovis T2Bo]EDO05412.2 PhoD-like (alkaline) phosphatase family protein [Babesia bovis T2Bo]
MISFSSSFFFIAILPRIIYALTDYERHYSTKLVSLPADEVVNEPLNKLGFGSCQKLELHPQKIWNSIVRYKPDMFLFTGDIVYAANGCCEPHCLKKEYDELIASKDYRDFAASFKYIDGMYDDHDFGVNDGHKTYAYREHSQKYLLDFFNKPEDHYRRKRKGAYFSMLFSDPDNPKHKVKLIVLDVRYHRECYYYCACDTCKWLRIHTNKFATIRLINYFFGFGCNHPGDTLGAEQWKWLQGQLHGSTAEAHIIVSSFQIFTRFPLTESWGLLPLAKDRLVDLLLTTKPKNPIFLSGDVHYGELNEKDGVVEVTSSSLTHSFLEHGTSPYRPFAISIFATKPNAYMYNNFGGVEFEYDRQHKTLKWSTKIFDVNGKVVTEYTSDASRDLSDIYRNVDKKKRSFFTNTRIVKCRGLLWRISLAYGILCLVTWMVLIPYVALVRLYRILVGTRKEKHH